MTVCYLVNIGDAQLYFNAELQRCPAPNAARSEGTGVTYFVRTDVDESSLVLANWDMGLAAFTEDQRRTAQLWKKTDA